MNRIKLSIRIPAEQETLIRHIAKVRGMTRYQALLRVLESGLASITGGAQVRSQLASEEALAAIESRLAIIESLTDRSLFTASAAYAYSRRAALRNDSDADRVDASTSDAAQAAYRRQRALAAEALAADAGQRERPAVRDGAASGGGTGRARGFRQAGPLMRMWREGGAMTTGTLSRSERIARLNDRARQAMGLACVAVATEGFRALPEADQSRVRELVETFDAFTPDNDPYGERDFGAIYQGSDGRWTTSYPVQGRAAEKVFWKIDAYDRDLRFGSEDPANPAVTRRVLTIMLASEY